MKISRAHWLLSTLILLGAPQANADLLNISTTGLQSQNDPVVACTIVGRTGNTWRGLKALIVASEAVSENSNPIIVAQVLESGETMANDTWTGSYLVNGSARAPLDPTMYQSLLRRLNGPNDAALLVSVPPGWRLCVRSAEVSGGGTYRKAQIAVTDVTDAFLRQFGASADHPAALQAIPAGTPNLMSTFARLLSTP